MQEGRLCGAGKGREKRKDRGKWKGKSRRIGKRNESESDPKSYPCTGN
jgi:hypothetical protein